MRLGEGGEELLGAGFSCSKRRLVCHSWFDLLVFGPGPRFGHEAADGQAAMVEQRDQDILPTLPKDADQAQTSGLTLAGERWVGWQCRQRTDRDSFLGCAPHTEQPQGGEVLGEDRYARPSASVLSAVRETGARCPRS